MMNVSSDCRMTLVNALTAYKQVIIRGQPTTCQLPGPTIIKTVEMFLPALKVGDTQTDVEVGLNMPGDREIVLEALAMYAVSQRQNVLDKCAIGSYTMSHIRHCIIEVGNANLLIGQVRMIKD